MGFFQDLKEDLSQAVNELMPEEEQALALQEEGKTDYGDGNGGDSQRGSRRYRS